MSRKTTFISLLLLGLTILLPPTASAHVLIGDDSKSIGAVLHVVPDDDPIAGQPSNLFFDIQTQKLNKNSAKLTITDVATAKAMDVPVKVDNNSVTADYTFPTQGVYGLSLAVTSDKAYVFNYSQRVSRGVTGSALDASTYPLANLALVFSGTMFLLLLVIMFNHRKDIKKHSTF